MNKNIKITLNKIITPIKYIIIISTCINIHNIANPYSYSFPKDHSPHKSYQLEWWYYTGHIETNNNKKYGYELTFFKVELNNKHKNKFPKWKTKPIFITHFAISDKTNKIFLYNEKINRPIGNIAGTNKSYLWNENSSIYIKNKKHILKAKMKNFYINFTLQPTKPPLIHGNGISKKGNEKNNFSYYYSITRLKTSGYIITNNNKQYIKGISWMDHEWMNNKQYFNAKWDWFSIQLNNNTEIMFYLIKDKYNNIKPVSQGTIYSNSNTKKTIHLKNIHINIIDYWISPKSKAKYPIEWKININNNILLHIKPFMQNQELITTKSTGITYWEGAVQINGTMNKKNVHGLGYVEMTGYAQIKQDNIIRSNRK